MPALTLAWVIDYPLQAISLIGVTYYVVVTRVLQLLIILYRVHFCEEVYWNAHGMFH